MEPKCNKTFGGIIQNRGETGQESTQLFYQMCRISKICKCLSVQMIFGAIGTLAGLMDAPSPTGTHSEDVIHQEKKKTKQKNIPFFLDTSDSNASFKMSPRFSPLFFALNISQLLIYFIICSEVSFLNVSLKKCFLFFFFNLMSRITPFPPGQESKGSLLCSIV